MITLRATINLHTPLGTPLAGDTLFGQLCWTAREQLGNEYLNLLLDGYTNGKPWLVVSDGFPSGYLPKPLLPFLFSSTSKNSEVDANYRKAEKNKRWIPTDKAGIPFKEWILHAVNDLQAYGEKPIEVTQPHNSIDRYTGTTGTGEFAPYTQQQIFYAHNQKIDLYLVLDETRLPQETLLKLLEVLGSYGYGRDASIGLGKFSVMSVVTNSFIQNVPSNAWLALAPCAPQGLDFDREKSYWRVITRFGRHGNRYGASEKPFKNPVLLSATGSVFIPLDNFSERLYIGQGLGGDGLLSKIKPSTVQQGYAPVIGIWMEG